MGEIIPNEPADHRFMGGGAGVFHFEEAAESPEIVGSACQQVFGVEFFRHARSLYRLQ